MAHISGNFSTPRRDQQAALDEIAPHTGNTPYSHFSPLSFIGMPITPQDPIYNVVPANPSQSPYYSASATAVPRGGPSQDDDDFEHSFPLPPAHQQSLQEPSINTQTPTHYAYMPTSPAPPQQAARPPPYVGGSNPTNGASHPLPATSPTHAYTAAISAPQATRIAQGTVVYLNPKDLPAAHLSAPAWDPNSRFSPVPESLSPLSSPSKASASTARVDYLPYMPSTPKKSVPAVSETYFDPPPPGALVSANENRTRKYDGSNSRPVSPTPPTAPSTPSSTATSALTGHYRPFPMPQLPQTHLQPSATTGYQIHQTTSYSHQPPLQHLQTTDPRPQAVDVASRPPSYNTVQTPSPDRFTQGSYSSRLHFAPVPLVTTMQMHYSDYETPRPIFDEGEDQLFTSVLKGVENPPGENHCFLNVIIQSLYRLTRFRDPFLQITHNHKADENCVLCSLQTILNAYQIKETSVTLDPSGFRNALAQLDSSVGRYQKADTAETFVLILEALHASLAPPDELSSSQSPSDSPKKAIEEGNFCTRQERDDGKCLIHQTFDVSYLAINMCPKCDYFKSESIHSWFHYVNTHKLHKKWSLFDPTPKFGQVLRQSALEKIPCPGEKCTAEIEPKLTLTGTPPPVFTLCLVWPMSVEPDDIRRVLDAFDEKLNLRHIFPDLADMEYSLQGFVAFWGEHYVTYQTVHSTAPKATATASAKVKRWVQFDDKLLRDLGSWSNCKEAIVKAHMRPVIAWFVRDTSN